MPTIRSENPDSQYSPVTLTRSAQLGFGGISAGQTAANGLVKNEYASPIRIEEVHFRVRQLPAMGETVEDEPTVPVNSLFPSTLRWYLHLVDVWMKLNAKNITAGFAPIIAFCPRTDETESHVYDEVAIWRPEPFVVDENDDLYCTMRWAPDAVPFNPDILNVLLPTSLIVEATFFGQSLPSGTPLRGPRRIPYVCAYREPVRPLSQTEIVAPIESMTPTAALVNGEEEPMHVQALMGARVTAYSPYDPGANDFIRIYDSNGALVTRDDVPMLELFGVRRAWDCHTVLKAKEYMSLEWNLGRQSSDDAAPQVNDFGQIPGARTFETTVIDGEAGETLLSRYQHIFGLVGYRETNLRTAVMDHDVSQREFPRGDDGTPTDEHQDDGA